ncbi:hypothetical protein GCM10027270_10010 [Nocardioides ginkgobilobae]
MARPLPGAKLSGRQQMRRTIGPLASGLALVAALSACGGDPAPQFEAEPSAEPTTASPSASAEPEPWQERTPEGAVAFAKHWTATFSEAFKTGETTALDEISAKQCEGCNFFVALIREVYDGGGSIDGDAWQFVNAGWSSPKGNESIVAVTGTMRIPAQTIRRSGEEPSVAAPLTERYIFTVSWTEGRWQTTELVRQA